MPRSGKVIVERGLERAFYIALWSLLICLFSYPPISVLQSFIRLVSQDWGHRNLDRKTFGPSHQRHPAVSTACSCPDQPPPSSSPTPPPSLAHFIAYALHHTRLTSSVTVAAPYLLRRLKTRFIAARGSSGHRLFISAFMIASKSSATIPTPASPGASHVCSWGDQPDGAGDVFLPQGVRIDGSEGFQGSGSIPGSSQLAHTIFWSVRASQAEYEQHPHCHPILWSRCTPISAEKSS